ncbi:MAG: hypothetical protein WCD24_03860 [Serratia inhibens]|uniref:hypothetical protein n=1 Tax=Serratia inhibens TaxID=2338073 RepID=UPI003C7B2247
MAKRKSKDQQKLFEEWFFRQREKCHLRKKMNGDYVAKNIQERWEIWQAAAEAQEKAL